MNIIMRVFIGIVYVGITVAVLFGLGIVVIFFADVEHTWLTRLGAFLIIFAIFLQGYLEGGDNNSETKSAD